MKRVRNVVAALVVVFLFTGNCESKEAPKKSNQKEAKAPVAATQVPSDSVNHKVLAFNLEGLNEKGAKKWDVKGDSAEAISENEVKLDNITAASYGEDSEAVITADKGIYDRAKNNVRLDQNVRATIEATQDFTGTFIDGADQGKGKNTRAGDAKDDEKNKKTKTVITCDGEAQFDYEKNQAVFLKNVKVVNKDGIIDADRITVYIDSTTRRVKEIVADGNVRIVRGENTTFSQRASYSEPDKKVVLSARPKLVLSPEGDIGLDGGIAGGMGKK